MALIKCVECGKEYSSTVKTCPNCGFVPSFRKCADCDCISSVKRGYCAFCGAVFDSDLIPVSSEETEEYYQTLKASLNSSQDADSYDGILRALASMEDYKDCPALLKEAEKKSNYLRAIALMDDCQSATDWKKARDGFAAAGDYEDSKELYASCDESFKELRYAELDELYKEAGSDKEKLKELVSGYGELGDYSDSPKRLTDIKKALNSGRNKVLKITIGSVAGVAILIGGFIGIRYLVTVGLPKHHLEKGIEAYEAQDYALAVDELTRAGSYDTAPKHLEEAQIALHYQTGDQLFNSGDYQAAIEEFTQAGEYLDSQDRIETCTLASHYVAGVSLMEEGSYEQALAEFDQCPRYEDTEDKVAEANYQWGMELLNAGELNEGAKLLDESGTDEASDVLKSMGEEFVEQKDYESLVTMFRNIYDNSFCNSYYCYGQGMLAYNDQDYTTAEYNLNRCSGIGQADELYPECAYNAGLESMASGEFGNADLLFSKSEVQAKYADAQALEHVCHAEFLNSINDFPGAYEEYAQVPEDLEVDCFDIQGRRSMFTSDAARTAYMICGEHEATSNDTSVLDKGTYYQDGWELTYVYPGQSIEFSVKMNDDGTFDYTGTVTYYAFTEYSIISDYTEGEIMYGFIDLSHVKKFPKEYEIDSDTTLTFKDNKFTLHYKYVDHYAISFKYIYESKVVYKLDQ